QHPATAADHPRQRPHLHQQNHVPDRLPDRRLHRSRARRHEDRRRVRHHLPGRPEHHERRRLRRLLADQGERHQQRRRRHVLIPSHDPSEHPMSTTERITLPSGAWIQLRDAKTLRRGDKKKAMAAVTGDGERLMKMAYEMTDGLLAVLVIDWSYPYPLPSESL